MSFYVSNFLIGFRPHSDFINSLHFSIGMKLRASGMFVAEPSAPATKVVATETILEIKQKVYLKFKRNEGCSVAVDLTKLNYCSNSNSINS